MVPVVPWSIPRMRAWPSAMTVLVSTLIMRPLASLVVLAVLAGCDSGRPQRLRDTGDVEAKPLITEPFADSFERAELGADWKATAPDAWKLENGHLKVEKAYNHPLWLMRKLPRDVQIDFDITSFGPDGDLKAEFFGDGKSFAADKGAYTSSGYVAIFGGWRNTISTLVRQYEHDPNRKERADRKVEVGRPYHFTITRQGTRIAFKLDGQDFLEIEDPQPMYGPGHEFFGFDNWEVPTSIDNLRIVALTPVNKVPATEDPSTAGR